MTQACPGHPSGENHHWANLILLVLGVLGRLLFRGPVRRLAGILRLDNRRALLFYGLLLLPVYGAHAQPYALAYGDIDDLSTAVYSGKTKSVAAQETAPNEVTFNPAGDKMYVIGTTGKDVNEYNLSTPWDVTTATFVQLFSVAAQDSDPTGLTFGDNGTKMYVVGSSNDAVYQYNLSTAWNVSTAVFNQSYSVSARELRPEDVTFNTAGNKMYVMGLLGDDINEYNLSTAWDISTAVYGTIFSVAGQETSPMGLSFSLDGTKLYVVGTTNDRIYAYTLSTAWSIATASYTGKSLSVAGQESNPLGLAINTAGDKLYMVGDGTDAIYEYAFATDVFTEDAVLNDGSIATGDALRLTPVGLTFAAAKWNSTLTLGTDYTITPAIPAGLTPVITVNATGTQATMTLTGNATAHQYINSVGSLNFSFTNSAFQGIPAANVQQAVAYTPPATYVDFYDNHYALAYGDIDLSTAVYTGNSKSIGVQESLPQAVTFNPAGDKMYVVGSTSKRVQQYSLSTPWDVTTASHVNVSVPIITTGFLTGLTFGDNGTKMYVSGYLNNAPTWARVYQYNLSTAWDVSTAVYNQIYSVAGQETYPEDVAFNTAGTKMYVLGSTGDDVNEYNLSTPWDISTATYGTIFPVNGQDIGPSGLSFSLDGAKLYVVGSNSDRIYAYTLSTAWSIATASYTGKSLSVAGQEDNPEGLAINTAGDKLYMIGYTNDRVYEYAFAPDVFTEDAVLNDGSIATGDALRLTPVNLTFASAKWGSTLTLGTDYTVTNVPAGLTPVIAVNATGTQAIMTLTGNAPNHQDIHDVSSLSFSFTDGVFEGIPAADVQQAVAYTPPATYVDFNDNHYALAYGDIDDLSTAVYTGNSFSVAAEETTPSEVTFNPTGDKMYVIGQAGDDVNEYNLSTPWDVTTASFVQVFSIAAQETDPQGLTFGDNGTKMYVVGSANDRVYQYNLSTAWDISTAVFNQFYSVAAQEATPMDVAFNAAGDKMYVLGWTGDDINEYNLSIPWDISTATFGTNFSISAQETDPRGFAFSLNGTKVYTIGAAQDYIHEYELSTAWDISTAVYTGNILIVLPSESSLVGLGINTAGDRMYIVGSTTDAIYEYAFGTDVFTEDAVLNDGSTPDTLLLTPVNLTFASAKWGSTLTAGTDYTITNLPAGLTPVITVNATGTQAIMTLTGNAPNHQDIHDVSSLSFSFTDGVFEGIPAADVQQAVAYTPPATYVDFNDNHYALAYGDIDDLSTTVYTGNTLSVAAQEANPRKVTFNPTGDKMYVIGETNDRVNEYSLSTPWDVTTATFVQLFSVAAQASNPLGFTFGDNGTKMYVVDWTNDAAYQYNLSTAWDISTAVYTQSYSVAAQETEPYAVAFNSTGDKMYVMGTAGDDINEYNLSTPWDIFTAIYGTNFSVGAQDGTPTGLAFSLDGKKLYVVGTTNDRIYEYALSTAWSISSATYTGKSLPVGTQDTSPGGVAFNTAGDRLYMVGYGTDAVYEYVFGTDVFTEDATLNDGSTPDTLLLTPVNLTFASAKWGSTLTLGTDYTITPAIPAGLTPIITVNATGTQATLTLTGNATDHQDIHDVSSLSFTFNDSAFEGVTAASVNQAVAYSPSAVFVDFINNPDSDGDTLIDPDDADADNDGIPDALEQANAFNGGDSDGDGIPDRLDLDSDNDGIPDLWESGIDAAQLATLDNDRDGQIDAAINVGANGLADSLETAADNGSINYSLANTDGNPNPDYLDLDSDNDGINDVREGGSPDADGDGLADGTIDSWGIRSSVDTSRLLPDNDCDGLPDFRELDSDDDGVPDLRASGLFELISADTNLDGLVDGTDGADSDGILSAADTDDAVWGELADSPSQTGEMPGFNGANLLLGLTFDAWTGTAEIPCADECPDAIRYLTYFGPGGNTAISNVSSKTKTTVIRTQPGGKDPRRVTVWNTIQPQAPDDPSICTLPGGSTPLTGANAARCYTDMAQNGNPYNPASGADQNGISLVVEVPAAAQPATIQGFYFEAGELNSVSSVLGSQSRYQLRVHEWLGGDMADPANVPVLFTSAVLESDPTKEVQKYYVPFIGTDTSTWAGKQLIFQVIPWNEGGSGTGMFRFDDLGIMGLCSSPLNLGNLVWEDSNEDGLFTGGESPLAGVAIEVYADNGDGRFNPAGNDFLVGTATTDAAGLWSVGGLGEGAYFARVAAGNFAPGGALEAYQPTPGAAALADSDTNNQDHGMVKNGYPQIGVVSSLVILAQGSEPGDDGDGTDGNLTLDFGFTQAAAASFPSLTLGNQVWEDSNNNGLLDGGEAGIANVQVDLYGGSCVSPRNYLGSATTDANGNYRFQGLGAGDYTAVVPGTNFYLGKPLAGLISSLEPLDAPDPDDDLDNGDNGSYSAAFPDAVASQPVSLALDSEPTTDGDSDANTNLTLDFGFNSAANPLLGNIGNLVWRDSNADGVADGGESGIAGVTLTLWQDNGDGVTNPNDDTPVRQTTTDASGLYAFNNLVAGTYYVQVDPANFAGGGALDGLYSTLDGQIADNDIDNDDNGGDNPIPQAVGLFSTPLSLILGQEPDTALDGDGTNGNLTLDFGFYTPPATMRIGNRVWRDFNDNAQPDSGEPGIDGVALTLFRDANGDRRYDAADTQAATTNTAGGGFYLFPNLAPGHYFVRVDAANWQAGGALEGLASSSTHVMPDFDVDNYDKGFDNVTLDDMAVDGLVSGEITLVPNTEPDTAADGDDTNGNLTIDWGFFQPMSLGNFIWLEADNDGLFDPGEQAADNVTVNLVQDNGDGVYDPATDALVALQTSSSTGNYQFHFLRDGGRYFVVLGSTQFSDPASPYAGYLSSTGAVPEDPAANDTDHGSPLADGSIASSLVSLVLDNEPTSDGDTDPNSQLSIDFALNRDANVDVSLEKAVAPANALRGDTVAYTLTVRNTGTDPASGVQVTDVLPAGVTLDAGTPPLASQGSYDPATGVWDLVDPLPGNGGEATLVITVTVD